MPVREHIERPRSMYMQVALRMADDIRRGRYRPGDLLPSETDMVAMYGIGKHTARSAVAELRRMGLAESRQGKGTIVLAAVNHFPPATTVDRSGAAAWTLPGTAGAGSPVLTRTVLEGPPAVLLDQADQDAISVERTLTDPTTGARWHHRTFIPMATASDVPALAEHPDAELSDLYRQLTDAGLSLTFTDHVTARPPYPDERTALSITSDASPLLITYRVTADADQHRPLLCEELKTPAQTCQLIYHVTPTRTPDTPDGHATGPHAHRRHRSP